MKAIKGYKMSFPSISAYKAQSYSLSLLPGQALDDLIDALLSSSDGFSQDLFEKVSNGTSLSEMQLERLGDYLENPSANNLVRSSVAAILGEVAKNSPNLPQKAQQGLRFCLEDSKADEYVKTGALLALYEAIKKQSDHGQVTLSEILNFQDQLIKVSSRAEDYKVFAEVQEGVETITAAILSFSSSLEPEPSLFEKSSRYQYNGKHYYPQTTSGYNNACAIHAVLGENREGIYRYNGDPKRHYTDALVAAIKTPLEDRTPAQNRALKAYSDSIRNYLTADDRDSQRLFNSERGKRLKEKWQNVSAPFESHIQSSRLEEGKTWLPLIQEPNSPYLNLIMDDVQAVKDSTSRWYQKSPQDALKMLQKNPSLITDFVDQQKDPNPFLNLLESSKGCGEPIKLQREQRKAIPEKLHATQDHFILSLEMVGNYVDTVNTYAFFLDTNDLKVVANLFNKKVVVIPEHPLIQHPQDPHNEYNEINFKHGEGKPIVIHHFGAHFSRCIKAKNLSNLNPQKTPSLKVKAAISDSVSLEGNISATAEGASNLVKDKQVDSYRIEIDRINKEIDKLKIDKKEALQNFKENKEDQELSAIFKEEIKEVQEKIRKLESKKEEYENQYQNILLKSSAIIKGSIAGCNNIAVADSPGAIFNFGKEPIKKLSIEQFTESLRRCYKQQDTIRLLIGGELSIKDHYTNLAIITNQEKQVLTSQLNNSLIRSLCHIPINLEIFCSLAIERRTLYGDEPVNLTAIYKTLVNWLIERFGKKYPEVQRLLGGKLFQNSTSEASKTKDYIEKSLEAIAWNMMSMNRIYLPISEIRKIIKESEKKKFLPKRIQEIRLLNVEEIGPLRINRNGEGQFIHLTFQEFFAAKYLVSLFRDGKIKEATTIIAEKKFYPRYEMIFFLTAGYLSLEKDLKNLQAYFNCLFDEPRDLAQSYELKLIARCFEECIDPMAIRQYGYFLKDVSRFISDFPLRAVTLQILMQSKKLCESNEIIESFISIFKNEKEEEEFINICYFFAKNKYKIAHYLENHLILSMVKKKHNFFVQRIISETLKTIFFEKIASENSIKTLFEKIETKPIINHKFNWHIIELLGIFSEKQPLARNFLVEISYNEKYSYFDRLSATYTLLNHNPLFDLSLHHFNAEEIFILKRLPFYSSEKDINELIITTVNVLLNQINFECRNAFVIRTCIYTLGLIIREENFISEEVMEDLSKVSLKITESKELDPDTRGSTAFLIESMVKRNKIIKQNDINGLEKICNDKEIFLVRKRTALLILENFATKEKYFNFLKSIFESGQFDETTANFLIEKIEEIIEKESSLKQYASILLDQIRSTLKEQNPMDLSRKIKDIENQVFSLASRKSFLITIRGLSISEIMSLKDFILIKKVCSFTFRALYYSNDQIIISDGKDCESYPASWFS